MSTPHLGWFRVDEESIRKINRSYDKPCDIRNATASYVMFCRKANLKGSHRFEDSIGNIARDLNVAYRDAQKAIALVEAIGLVEIERRKVIGTKANAPSMYTVVWLGSDVTTEHPDIMSEGTDNMSEGSRKDGVPFESRTFPKNTSKKKVRTANNGAVGAVVALPFISEAFLKAATDWQEHLKQIGIRTSTKATELQWQKCLEWGEKRTIEAIYHSILSNYRKIYEPSIKAMPAKRKAPDYNTI